MLTSFISRIGGDELLISRQWGHGLKLIRDLIHARVDIGSHHSLGPDALQGLYAILFE